MRGAQENCFREAKEENFGKQAAGRKAKGLLALSSGPSLCIRERLENLLDFFQILIFFSKGLVAINRKKGSAPGRPEEYAERPYVCARCNCRFKKRSHLRAHEASHDGIKRFLCNDCGKWVSKNLKFHIMSNLRNFRPFSSKPALKHHIVVMHTDSGKTYECSVCGQHYSTKAKQQFNYVKMCCLFILYLCRVVFRGTCYVTRTKSITSALTARSNSHTLQPADSTSRRTSRRCSLTRRSARTIWKLLSWCPREITCPSNSSRRSSSWSMPLSSELCR